MLSKSQSSQAFMRFKATGVGKHMMGKNKIASSTFRKPEFQSEYEFFLHHIWSQKGYKIEDNSDEYYNLTNLQSSQSMKQNPESTKVAHRTLDVNQNQEPMFFKQKGEAYTQRVPISFNFQVPQTLIVNKGKAVRWYYSTKLGQVRIHNTNRSLLRLIEGK